MVVGQPRRRPVTILQLPERADLQLILMVSAGLVSNYSRLESTVH